jgi:hypothetical protein
VASSHRQKETEMKKFVIVLSFVIGAWGSTQAQGVSTFFSQSETRLKYYAEQIATLQGYIADAEKGYKIVESGLQTVDQIKNGEFNLHNAFYTALKTVSPTVKNIAARKI